MLLTRKATATAVSQGRLARGLSGVMAKTMDRRAFLKRSGITVGAGAVASQLPFSMIGEPWRIIRLRGKFARYSARWSEVLLLCGTPSKRIEPSKSYTRASGEFSPRLFSSE